MTLEYATQSAASSEMDTYKDSAMFSSDIAVLYGSEKSHTSICMDCAETSDTVHLQSYWDGDATDARIPIDSIQNTTSGPQNHSCQISACAMA